MSEETMTEETIVETQTEEVQKFDPKQVEEELLRMAQERADDPAEMAATCYRTYLPFYKVMSKNKKLSTRALRRILDFLILYPLESDKANATSKEEREMMELCNTLIQAKFVLILDTYNQNAQQIYDAATTPLTSEEEAQVVADLKAGGASDEDIAAIHKPVDKVAAEVVTSVQGE